MKIDMEAQVRESKFVTELFERYKRMTGAAEEAIFEMYQFSGISVHKMAGVTESLSKVSKHPFLQRLS